MAYLAAFWTVAGYSVVATRIAMLLVASAAVLVAFLLAIELCRNVRGAPAFMAVFLLCVSPLFFAQAMLAQLDMPAMLFTCLALLLFLQDKIRLAALTCTALVLVKETGLLVPLLFAAWLFYEKRRREAAWFLLPVGALAAWLAVLAHATGHLFGNSEFTRYNLYYPFHPVRFLFALGRRLYYLFFQDFHWIGTVAILLAVAPRHLRDARLAHRLGADCHPRAVPQRRRRSHAGALPVARAAGGLRRHGGRHVHLQGTAQGGLPACVAGRVDRRQLLESALPLPI